jgi:hypothetical protein
VSAFGLNRFAQAYAAAVQDAGTRVNDRALSAVDRLASDLFEWAHNFGGYVSWEQLLLFVYPFVGGTAVSNSFNLINPSVGRVTWASGTTHADNFGVMGGSTAGMAYGDTGIAGPATFDKVPCMFGVYVRTTNLNTVPDIYCCAGELSINPRYPASLVATVNFGKDASAVICQAQGSVPTSVGMTASIRHPQVSLNGSILLYKDGQGIASVSKFLGAVAPAAGNWQVVSPQQQVVFAFTTQQGAVMFDSNAVLELWRLVYYFNWRMERQIL